MNTIKEKGKKQMHERLIIDGNSVYEVDEECLKRRNVPTECRVKRGCGTSDPERKKSHKRRIAFYMQKRDADTASLFGIVHLLLHTFLTQILEDSAASVSVAASATE